MYGLAQIVLASVTLSSMTAASPLEKRGSFSVTQKLNPKFVSNGPAAYVRAFKKYNWQIPHDLAVATGNDGSVTADPTGEAYGPEYACPVSIDGQTLHLNFDTGSSDLWVFSTSLPPDQQIGHNVFDPSQSPNWHELSGYTWSVQYQHRSGVFGTVGTDVVTVGGTSVSGQAVEIAERVTPQSVSYTAVDGLLGLGFSGLNTVKPQPQNTFFDTAKPSLSSPVFTADLKYHAPGIYDFGFIDSSKYDGPITYVDVDDSNNVWAFTGSGYAVGSDSFVPYSINAILDTGMPLILLPDDVVRAYYDQVPGALNDTSQGGYTFPCSTTLPDLTLGIDNYFAVVPGEYINYAPGAGSKCFGGIQSNGGVQSNGGSVSLYGDIFFQSQFVIFDGSDAPRLGFAAKST